jgi:DNA-binding transcriptional ArsR family regulator
MIVVRLSARSVAAIRLAPSLASELVAWLKIAAAGQRHPVLGDPGPAARFAMRHPDVALVATMLRGNSGYIPDLLTPKPSVDPPARILGSQLDAVRETSAETAATQLLVGRYPGQRMPTAVRRAMEAGTFARRAANGLHHFWLSALADNWTTLEAAMAADLRRRAWTGATHGIGHAVNTLHSKVRWSGDHVRIHMRYVEESDLTNSELVFSPAILGWPRIRVQVCDPANAVIVYPASEIDILGHRNRPLLAALVGSTRAKILNGLHEASTTTQLGQVHGLALSTVSHHLRVLVEAGMVTKARIGAFVHYVRTERGDELVRHSGRARRQPN